MENGVPRGDAEDEGHAAAPPRCSQKQPLRNQGGLAMRRCAVQAQQKTRPGLCLYWPRFVSCMYTCICTCTCICVCTGCRKDLEVGSGGLECTMFIPALRKQRTWWKVEGIELPAEPSDCPRPGDVGQRVCAESPEEPENTRWLVAAVEKRAHPKERRAGFLLLSLSFPPGCNPIGQCHPQGVGPRSSVHGSRVNHPQELCALVS